MNKSFYLQLLLLSLILSLSLGTQSASATTMVAVIETSQEVSSALGIIVTPTTFEKYPAESIKRVNPNEVHIFFSAPVKLPDSQSLITAMGIAESGKVLFANLRQVENFTNPTSTCQPNLNIPEALTGHQSHLYSLLEIRGARREVLREQLKVLMSQKVLTDLNNLEHLLGLDHDAPISLETNIFELTNRLFRLKATVSEMK
jgi:hypothetical protein